MRLPGLKFYKPRQEELGDDEEEDDREDEGEELDDDDDENESTNGNGNGNGPGLGGNNNGPPGSEGSPKRPSRHPGPPNTVTSTELSPSPNTSALPLETLSSGLPPPKEIVTSTTSSSSTAIPNSTSPASTISTSIALPPPETTSSPVVSQSEIASSTSLTTLSPPTSAETTQVSLGDTMIPVLGTATSSTTTSSTTLQLDIGFAAPNDTAKAGDAATNSERASQIAGIAVGSIGERQVAQLGDKQTNDRSAGFAFLLTFIILFYKWHKRTLLKTPSSSNRRLTEKWRVSTWTPRPRSPDAMENSLLASEERSGEGIPSNSQPIFEKPPVPQTLRQSFHNSITRLVRMNPLALHPAMAGAPGSVSPRPKSFVSSIFRRYSAASSYTARSEHSILPDQLQVDPLPPIPSVYQKQGQREGYNSV